MALTHRRSRGRYVVAALLLASLTLITLDARGSGALRSARNATQSVLTPIESGIHTALRPVGNFLAGAADYGSVKAENERLRAALANDATTQAEQQYLKQEEQQVLKQLDLPFAGQIRTVAAAVTTQPSSNFEAVITIDKGTSSGVAVGQPVANSSGLIGRVSEAGSGTSTITLLSNPGFYCGVSLAKGDTGSVEGQGLGHTLKMAVLPNGGRAASLKKGQQLYTSEVGGTYPPGIPVGRIQSVDADGVNTTAVVAPAVNTSDLGFVDVMLWSGQ